MKSDSTEAVFDTSPLQYLHQIGRLELAHKIFCRVIIPRAVDEELARGRALARNLPIPNELNWMELLEPLQPLHATDELGPGELAAIALALESHGRTVVLDDLPARKFAQQLNIPFIGTVGILLAAKKMSLIRALRPELDNLRTKGFYLSAHMTRLSLVEAGEL